jgi:hypothetical protein
VRVPKSEFKYLLVGALGALIILYGTFQTPPQKYYIVGSFVLLLIGIHYKLIYFVALECIVLTGHSAILLGLPIYTQVGLPILLCVQLLVFYIMLGKQNNIILLIGIVGIAMLCLGFNYKNPWVFLSGSTSIATYSYFYAFRGDYPCFIWALLNTCFVGITIYRFFL